ncbi:MAG: hypothetical protein LBI60_04540 [Bacteroidales bacterium]|jgi:hypothetical protein|nr:hypothetical protein [Bacteroidales bacterium]
MLNKIDIKGGEFTFEQRNDLGELFSSGKTEVEKFKGAFKILHGIDIDFSDTEQIKNYIEYFEEIIDGLRFWFEGEKKLLAYKPEPEEIRAGIKELSEKIGVLGTIKALAKNYSQDPDTILKWKYGKVFGILYADLEEYKYQKRLHKQYGQKK